MINIKHTFSKQNRVLLAELVRTDFKLRYQGSVLGYAWSLLRPLFIFLILYIVFVKFLKIDAGSGIPHYPIYLLLGIVMWNFFSEMTIQSLTSIVGRGELVRKIKIPRWIIVFSTSISALINLGLNLIVIAIFMVFNKVSLSWSIILLPLSLFELYVFALGLSLLFSAFYVKYRDIIYIWEVSLQALFYLTPILYPLTKITSLTAQKVLLLNPVAQTIQDARYSAVTHITPTVWSLFNHGLYSLAPIVLVVIIFTGGTLYFKKESKYFAENI